MKRQSFQFMCWNEQFVYMGQQRRFTKLGEMNRTSRAVFKIQEWRVATHKWAVDSRNKQKTC